MAKIDETTLIEMVRNHECLYNMKSKHYRDHSMRAEAWEEIAQEMGSAGNAVKTTWTKLRNCFLNAHKRRKTKSGQAATTFVKWKYEKEMKFLLPYLASRQTHTNLDPSTEKSEELNDVDDEADHETAEFLVEQEWSSRSGSSCGSVLEKQKPKRSQEIVKIMKEDVEPRRSGYQSVPKEDHSTLDETDMFYLSMARTAKRLHPIEQAKIRMNLCNMISEAEIREIRTQAQP